METVKSTTVPPHTRRRQQFDALVVECGVFFAFSREQFVQGKASANLQDGEKLIDIGAGGFMPARNKQRYIDGAKAIYDEFYAAMKDAEKRRAYILYELNNHEAFYSRCIDSTMDALGEDFTHDEVLAVFKGR